MTLSRIYKIVDMLLMHHSEKELIDLLLKNDELMSEKEIVIFDIGCYKGEFSKRINKELKNRTEKKIIYHLFDPNIKCKNYLKDNLRFSYNYKPYAISDTNSEAIYYYNPIFESAGSSLNPLTSKDELWKISRSFVLGKKKQPFQPLKVKTFSIDNYCEINNINKIDIIKIDVEGSQLEVIKGMEKMLHFCSIIYIEIFASKKTYKSRSSELISYLSNNNFVMLKNRKILSSSIFSSLKVSDALFINKDLVV